MSKSADLGDRAFKQPGRLREQRLIFAFFSVAGELDQYRQRDEVLLGTIMQVAFEAAPFFVSGCDQPAARRLDFSGALGK